MLLFPHMATFVGYNQDAHRYSCSPFVQLWGHVAQRSLARVLVCSLCSYSMHAASL